MHVLFLIIIVISQYYEENWKNSLKEEIKLMQKENRRSMGIGSLLKKVKFIRDDNLHLLEKIYYEF